jgi:hypothetical protein
VLLGRLWLLVAQAPLPEEDASPSGFVIGIVSFFIGLGIVIGYQYLRDTHREGKDADSFAEVRKIMAREGVSREAAEKLLRRRKR